MVWSAPADPAGWRALAPAGLLYCIQQERADHVRWLWVQRIGQEERPVARSAKLPRAAGDVYAVLSLQSVGELMLLAEDGRGGYTLSEPWQHWIVCYGDEPRAMSRLTGLYHMAMAAREGAGKEHAHEPHRRRRRRDRGIG